MFSPTKWGGRSVGLPEGKRPELGVRDYTAKGNRIAETEVLSRRLALFLATAKSRTLDAVHAEDDVCFISSAIREVNQKVAQLGGRFRSGGAAFVKMRSPWVYESDQRVEEGGAVCAKTRRNELREAAVRERPGIDAVKNY